uniref:Uncharacterized protein n=1 Tax=Anguilla anguilla TaxID=7936 RepID=A0A0E9PQS8_ANGAN
MSFKREGEEPHMCLLKSRTSLCRSCLFFAADPSTGPNSTLIGWVLVKGMDHLTLVQLPMAEKEHPVQTVDQIIALPAILGPRQLLGAHTQNRVLLVSSCASQALL